MEILKTLTEKVKRSKLQSWLWLLLIGFTTLGWFVNSFYGYAAIICMSAPVLFAIVKGRFWCGWFCPRGSFFDTIITKFSFNRKIPDIMLKPWFRAIIFTLLMSGLTLQLSQTGGELQKMGVVIVRLITVTTVIGIFLGIFIHPRSWCVICPMGSLATFFGQGKYLLKIESTCIGCKKCVKACPVQIAPVKFKPVEDESLNFITNPNCLKCEKCVNACPTKALSFPKAS